MRRAADTLERVLQTNLISAFATIQAFYPLLKVSRVGSLTFLALEFTFRHCDSREMLQLRKKGADGSGNAVAASAYRPPPQHHCCSSLVLSAEGSETRVLMASLRRICFQEPCRFRNRQRRAARRPWSRCPRPWRSSSGWRSTRGCRASRSARSTPLSSPTRSARPGSTRVRRQHPSYADLGCILFATP